MHRHHLFTWLTLFSLLHLVLSYSKTPPRLASSKFKSNPVIYLVGSKVQLQCPVYADPKRLFVEWMRNNVPVEYIHRYFVTLNGYLRIEFAQPEDSGVYTCKAVNGFGSVYANITLSIMRQEDLGDGGSAPDNRYPFSAEYLAETGSMISRFPDDQRPYFTSPPTTKAIKKNAGKPLRLRCNVGGRPKPEIAWYKNGSPINMARLPTGSQWYGGTLTIPRARLEDSGYYMCVVSNSKGQINATFSVTISDKINRPEIIQIKPENSTVLLGQRAIFECQFKSKSKPLVKWLKECLSEELDEETDDDRGILVEIDGKYYRSLRSSSTIEKYDGIYYNKLTIDSATRRDSGRYLCSVVNYKGYSYKISHLSVITSTEMNQLRDLSLPAINYCTLFIVIIAIIGCIVLVICFTFFFTNHRTGTGAAITDPLGRYDLSAKFPILEQNYQQSIHHHRHLQPTSNLQHHQQHQHNLSLHHNNYANHNSNHHQYYIHPQKSSNSKQYESLQKITNAIIETNATSSTTRSLGII